jgi:hypothetical protein
MLGNFMVTLPESQVGLTLKDKIFIKKEDSQLLRVLHLELIEIQLTIQQISDLKLVQVDISPKQCHQLVLQLGHKRLMV